ncbi:MAG: hypothetical protein MR598_04445 [Erysipelotrichaceae bacterium]|nr:hypothetical protein [Erysipelotrichaceae bacterium]
MKRSTELNFFQKYQKKSILNKLNKTKDINIYKNIKDFQLKADLDIKLASLNCVKLVEDFELFYADFLQENINKCNEFIQKLFFEKYNNNIQYLSFNMQYSIAKDGKIGSNILELLNDKVKERLVNEDNHFINKFGFEDKKMLCLKDVSLIELLKKSEQEKMIEENNQLIFYCSKEFQKELLEKCSLDVIYLYAKTNNLSLEEFYQLGKFNYDNKNNLNLLENYIKTKDKDEIDQFYFSHRNTFLADAYKFSDDIQNDLYERRNLFLSEEYLEHTMIENYPHKFVTQSIYISPKFYQNKFIELYGENKFNEYKELFDSIDKKSFIGGSNILFSFIDYKNSIIEKNDAKRVISFIELYEKKDKTEEEYAYLYNEFYDLIGNTYGEKALSILKNRPGLNYGDIDNIEIFSPNVLNNFDLSFVDDLLSYNFGGYIHEFIEICNNHEDLHAFKMFYHRMGTLLGKNPDTMLFCFTRFNEYKNLLIDAYQNNNNMDQEALRNLDKICMWPKNIANINGIHDLSNLEEKLFTAIQNNEITLKNSYDGQVDVNVGEKELYDFHSFIKQNGSEDALKGYEFFQNHPYVKNLMNTDFIEYYKNGGNLTDLFWQRYLFQSNIKRYTMEEFQKDIVTDKNYIDKKFLEGKDRVQKINVNGIEIYDLGDMDVNYAVHELMGGGNSVSDFKYKKFNNEFLTTDNKEGISTISAYPVIGKNYDSKLGYVYWNFKGNEIVSLKTYSGATGDGRVSHDPKRIHSFGKSDTKLLNCQLVANQVISSGDHMIPEISFYRRIRDQLLRENSKYGGKIIPDAIRAGSINIKTLDLANGRFGKKIPIILNRGSLQTEKQRNDCIKEVTRLLDEMEQSNQISKKNNYHSR